MQGVTTGRVRLSLVGFLLPVPYGVTGACCVMLAPVGNQPFVCHAQPIDSCHLRLAATVQLGSSRTSTALPRLSYFGSLRECPAFICHGGACCLFTRLDRNMRDLRDARVLVCTNMAEANCHDKSNTHLVYILYYINYIESCSNDGVYAVMIPVVSGFSSIGIVRANHSVARHFWRIPTRLTSDNFPQISSDLLPYIARAVYMNGYVHICICLFVLYSPEYINSGIFSGDSSVVSTQGKNATGQYS